MTKLTTIQTISRSGICEHELRRNTLGFELGVQGRISLNLLRSVGGYSLFPRRSAYFRFYRRFKLEFRPHLVRCKQANVNESTETHQNINTTRSFHSAAQFAYRKRAPNNLVPGGKFGTTTSHFEPACYQQLKPVSPGPIHWTVKSNPVPMPGFALWE